jgi:hypothetical protein
MARSPLKVQSATVHIIAYDKLNEVVDSIYVHSKLTPSVMLLEFMMETEERYQVSRYEMTIAYEGANGNV